MSCHTMYNNAMQHDTWQKQTKQPLFPELEWNKPERRDQAGRLLVIGGNSHALSAPANAYQQSKRLGIGDVKAVLPVSTKRLIDKSAVDALFLPSTPSGEFSRDGELELLDYASWADTLLFAGDVGRNSQTTILLESIVRSFSGQIICTKDAVDSLLLQPKILFERESTTLVVSFSQLQKLLKNYSYLYPLSFNMELAQLVEYLNVLSKKIKCSLITLHNKQYIVAHNGTIVTTKITSNTEPKIWRLSTAVAASCYQTWSPTKPLEALAQAIYQTVDSSV
jgi:NAD(P)H-hydrate repair Nnr-like enzyme with NAD(P)H-hydrate dehydratase domain